MEGIHTKESEKLNPPNSINFKTLQAQDLCSNWSDKSAAVEATKGRLEVGRKMGHVYLHLNNLSEKDYDTLIQPYNIVDDYMINSGIQEKFDQDGEYNTKRGQITLSRIYDLHSSKELQFQSNKDDELFNALYSMQSPQSSVWKRPFIRLISVHKYQSDLGILTLKYFVYFSRLVFELIADKSIKTIMDNIKKPPYQIIPIRNKGIHPKLFESINEDMLLDPDFSFSIPGLMKYSESKGYPLCDSQPSQLKVKLYDFQKSTYQWMLDQELDVDGGLNSWFWEEHCCIDGGNSMYYFPIAGEFRLKRPPNVKGGILSEEMGLGKTLEVISLILGNPRKDLSINQEAIDLSARYKAKSTLVVVPPNLIGQWEREFYDKVEGCGDSFKVIKINFPLSKSYAIPLDQVKEFQVSMENDNFFPIEIDSDILFHDESFPTNCYFKGILKKYLPNKWDSKVDDVKISANIEETLIDYDVVLVTYEYLRIHRNIFNRIDWHRIVLDECQEIKIPTNGIALLCANLKSNSNWMVSGTPLSSTIEDLHGELNFLKVWPFSLGNKFDGFWEAKIGLPFRKRSKESLKLLYSLLDVVMMRHSKTQRYLSNGEPLVVIPSRTVEWRSFDLLDPSEVYFYRYLECFASDAIEIFLRNRDYMELSNYFQIRRLYDLLSKCISRISAIVLSKLDHLLRTLLNTNITLTKSNEIHLLSAEEILAYVRGLGQGKSGGLNYASNRNLANVARHEIEERERAKYDDSSISELKKKLIDADIPIPMVWAMKDFKITIENGNNFAICTRSNTKEKKVPKLLSSMFNAGDRIRLGNSDLEANEVRVISLDDDKLYQVYLKEREEGAVKQCPKPKSIIGTMETDRLWSLISLNEASVFRYQPASTKESYINLLVAKSLYDCSTLVHDEIHAQGFESIYKLMRQEAIECPLCLEDCCRPVVTTCVHVYCFVCISRIIGNDGDKKCPVCRRPLTIQDLLECNMEISETLLDDEDAIRNEVKRLRDDSNIVDPSDENRKIFSVSSSSLDRSHLVPQVSATIATPDKDNDTKLIIPQQFSSFQAALVKHEVNKLPYRPSLFSMLPLNAQYPSLNREILTFHHLWESKSMFSSRDYAILSDMKDKLQGNVSEKFVIFSQYSESLFSLMETINYVSSNNHPISTFYGKLGCVMIDSKTSAANKEKYLQEFMNNKNCNVLLLTLGSSSTGLTLTNASVCYFMEPTANPTDEAQALSRVHRIGQQRKVHCVIFYAKDTCEERLLALRHEQGNLSSHLCSDAEVLVENEIEKTNQTIKRKRKELSECDSGFFRLDNLCRLYGTDENRRTININPNALDSSSHTHPNDITYHLFKHESLWELLR